MPYAPAVPAPEATSVPADLVALWQPVLRQLEERLPAAEFDTWLRDTVLVELAATTAVVGVANTFVRERVAAVYAHHLVAALAAACGRPITGIELVIMGP